MTTGLAAAVEAVLADPLRESRAAPGGFGHVGADLPPDLVLAARQPFPHLPWRTGRATPFADRWLESSFPGWARSILEDWSAGRFDHLEAVVFSRGEDAAQRLYYYVAELQRTGRLRGPRPLVYDIARIPRDTSLRHTQSAVRRLATEIGLDDAALCAGIERANALRARVDALQATRAGHGVLHHRLQQASLFTDAGVLIDAGMPAPVATGPRLLLLGSAPPDARLHAAVAAGGGDIVAEAHGQSFRRLGPATDVAVAEDPALSIARQRRCTAGGPRDFGDPGTRLESLLALTPVDAVLLWLVREDEALAWHVPAQQAVLRARGLPALVLTARAWEAPPDDLAQVTRFVEALAT